LLDKDKIKQNLTLDNIKNIVTHLGSEEPIKDFNGNFIFQTICHNTPSRSNKFKLYYYDNTKLFRCYTECQDAFDIFELVKRVKQQSNMNYSFEEAILFISNFTGISFSLAEENLHYNKLEDWIFIDRYKKIQKALKPLEHLTIDEVNPHVLEVFKSYPYQGWLDEGITKEAMKKFNIGFYLQDQKITIPHYDINNKLIGIRGRTILQEEVAAGRKYMPIKVENKIYRHPISFNLYGLNFNFNTIKKQKKIIIFESEKSVLKCESFYPDKNFSVAVCGSNISKFQRNIILNLPIEEVIIAFDKEYDDITSKEYKKYYNDKLIELANKFAPYFRTYLVVDRFDLLERKDSPCDKSKKILEKLMKHKIEIKTK